jgi:hypothetical protein
MAASNLEKVVHIELNCKNRRGYIQAKLTWNALVRNRYSSVFAFNHDGTQKDIQEVELQERFKKSYRYCSNSDEYAERKIKNLNSYFNLISKKNDPKLISELFSRYVTDRIHEIQSTSASTPAAEELASLFTQLDHLKIKNILSKKNFQILFDKLTKSRSKFEQETNKRKKTCSPIDLSQSEGLGPVLDQGISGLCYAYAASDMLSQRLKKRVSPIHVAYTFINEFYEVPDSKESIFYRFKRYYKNFFNERIPAKPKKNQFKIDEETGVVKGGKPYFALENMNKYGVCISPENKQNSKSVTIRDIVKASDSERSFNLNSSLEEAEDNFSVQSEIKSLLSDSDNSCDHLIGEKDKLTHSNLNSILQATSPMSIVSQWIQDHCSNTTPLQKMNLGYLGFQDNRPNSSPPAFMSKINQSLEKGDIVGISYFALALVDPTNITEGAHSSTIVGRKFDEGTGSCNYIIRNTHGDDCTNPFGMNFGHYSYECKEGHISVPEAKLKQILRSVTYFN